MEQAEAKDVLDMTRTWFKQGFKASNKVRMKEGTPQGRLPGEEGLKHMTPASMARAMEASERMIDSVMTNKEEEYALLRAGAKHALGVTVNEPKDADMLALGYLISRMRIRSGNCADYTAFALYYAKEIYQASGYAVRLIEGDHVFAVFPAPGIILTKLQLWRNISSKFMAGRGKTWVVDGWANIVCHPDDYHRSFTQKMTQWTGSNKRVLWKPHGSNRDELGWWIPPNDEKYIEEFSDSRLEWKT